MIRLRSLVLVSSFALAAVHVASSTAVLAGPNDWPQFRGVSGAGVAGGTALPTKWSATENVAWTAEIPGTGWSSPIVWGKRVYVTTAVNASAFKAPSKGIYGNDYAAELKAQGLSDEEIGKRVIARDIELASEAVDVSYRVIALDSTTGKVVWSQESHKGKPFGGRHRKNTYASETPATDGERIYASFGANVGLFCYTMDGKLLWKKTWTPQPIYLDFGTASSPVVHDGRVYALHDNEAESFFVALDAKTGEEVWKVDRTSMPARMKSGWATPFVWKNSLRTEIVTIGKGHVVSYSTDGKELWRLRGMTQATPSPVANSGLLIVGSGSQGETTRPVYAIKPGASGDISQAEGQPKSEFIAWFLPRFSAYTGSPLLYQGRVYAINDNGVIQVADATTGAEVYKTRVGGGGTTFSSSPIAAGGKLYLQTEDGDTYVIEAGDEYKEVSKNPIGEIALASPAADGDSVYVRTQSKLYRFKTGAKAKS